jgi:hypothetical protein
VNKSVSDCSLWTNRNVENQTMELLPATPARMARAALSNIAWIAVAKSGSDLPVCNLQAFDGSAIADTEALADALQAD